MAAVRGVPDEFVADLRHLRPWPELTDSLWRSPALVELTYGRMWRLVAEVLPAPPARILDVGCGTGVLTLEAARGGHDVTGIDADPDAYAVATRSAAGGGPGRLAYRLGDADSWEPETGGFDTVMTTRMLHHVPDPAGTLGRMRRWLRPGGRLVCVDFGHDRFDPRAARWLAQVRGLLEAAGHFHGNAPLPVDPDAATERIEWEWEQEHVVEHQLNTAGDIVEPLQRLFHVEEMSWHPYLYWDILVGLDTGDPRTEASIGALMAGWEGASLAAARLPGLLFRCAATAYTPD
jgi:SAM-dependent methyltransferase